jgi:PDZ domain-containing secreted protein
VRSVEKNSAAEKAGLKAGDVIVKADNEKLTDRSDLSHILRNHRTGGKMTMVVMRDKHEQTLTVTLPDRGSRDSSFLNLDADELRASLANVEDMVQDLDIDHILSTADMASLNRNMALLDMSHLQKDLLQSPEIEKAMREAQKVLQGLKFGCDPI